MRVRRAGIAVALALAGCGSAPQESAPVRPDVVIVTWDTARADHVGPDAAVRGLTPRWSRLAGDGVRFANARTPSPMTLPAHASLLTGATPPHHGARVNTLFAVPDAVETLAERLSAEGWRTAAFVSAAVLDARYGLAQGFGHYDGSGGGEGDERGFAARRADATVDAARAWIASQPASESLFVWVHLFDPHAPYEAPEPWLRRHPDDPYGAEIEYVDHQTGRLIDAIAGASRYERTLLVLTADHGEALGEHGEPTHGYFAYDATLRVPLLLRAGGRTGVSLPRNARIDAPVLLSDVAPTLLELLGQAPLGGDGVSLAPLLRGETAPARELAVESVDPYYVFGAAPAFGVVDAGGEVWIDLPRRERYAPAADPGELKNLYEPAQSAQADALFARHPRAWPPAAPNAPADPQLEQQLAALGYLSGRAGAGSNDTGPAQARPDPKDLLPVAALWMDQHDVRRPDRALAEADALAKRFGPLPSLAFYRADRLDELARPDRAIELLREASRAYPAESRLREELAERLALREQDRALAERIRGIWKQQPEHPAAEHDLAVVLQRLGEVDAAIELYRSWLTRHPTDVSARIDLSRLLGANGKLDEALAVLRAAPAGAGRKARLDCEEGRVLLDWLEQPEQARPLFERCLEKGGELGPRENALVAAAGR